jgi:putative transferase (TIGR04331 family)
MQNIRQLLEASLANPQSKAAIIRAVEAKDATLAVTELEQIALQGEHKLVQACCDFFAEENTSVPEIYNLLGYIAHCQNNPQEAAFYFMTSFVVGRYLPAAENLLEIYRLLNLRTAGLCFARSLTSAEDTPRLSELRQYFEGRESTEVADPTHATFLVSKIGAERALPNSKVLLSESFLEHILERDGIVKKFRECEVAGPLRTQRDDLAHSINFVTQKNELYLEILSQRLNTIHNLTGSLRFWRKAFGIALIRHITLLYDFFQICERYYSPSKHTCETLSPSSYHIPLDYDEQRWFLQHQHFGQEQLLSLYKRTFYPDDKRFFDGLYDYQYKVSPVGVFHPTQPKVGIMCAFFAPRYLNELVTKSGGAIQSVGFDRNFPIYDKQHNPEARKFLSQLPPHADRFDRFFFETLPEFMPRVFIEYFIPVASQINQQLSHYTNLEYAVSEMWLSETYECLALALLGERGVKHIYNEHNYNEYPFYANQLHQQTSVPDIFLAHGNYSAPINNLVNAGSLFEFVPDSPPVEKKNKLLYVSGIGLAKYSNYSHVYMDTSEHVPIYYGFKRKFFEAIDDRIRSCMVYRSYPRDEYSRMWEMYWDDRYIMSDLLAGITLDDCKRPCKSMMAETSLVVVDYMSTTHLEALSMNIPTVFFVRWDSAHFSDANKDFLEELIEVGICQSDPKAAAQFISSILDNPSSWWMTEKVQAARTRFLARNVGDPQSAINYYLGLLR